MVNRVIRAVAIFKFNEPVAGKVIVKDAVNTAFVFMAFDEYCSG